MAVRRLGLREQIQDELAGWLDEGRLAPGQRLEETRLARALGVSRTPLREALAALAGDGLVESEPHRGYRVPELSAESVRDIYPVIGNLEGLAIRLSGPDIRLLAPQLDEINARLGAPHLSPRQRSELDRRWHETLVSRCRNRELGGLIGRLRRRVRPYGGAWDRSAPEIAASRAEHEALARMLAGGRAEEAAEAVLRHWVEGVRRVTAWLREKPG